MAEQQRDSDALRDENDINIIQSRALNHIRNEHDDPERQQTSTEHYEGASRNWYSCRQLHEDTSHVSHGGNPGSNILQGHNFPVPKPSDIHIHHPEDDLSDAIQVRRTEDAPAAIQVRRTEDAPAGIQVRRTEDAPDSAFGLSNKCNNGCYRETPRLKCRICYVSPMKDMFLPCGHLVACDECSKLFTDCPFCNMKIMATVAVELR